jgi:membrane protease YdiL (CAAX protease family)
MPAPQQEVHDRWRAIRSTPARFVEFFVALAAVDVLCQLAPRLLHTESLNARSGVWAVGTALTLSVAMVGTYRLLVRVVERRRAQELGRAHAVRLALAGAVCGTVLFAAVEMLLALKGVAHIGGYAGTAYVGQAIAVSLASGVGEEILFRGVVFRIVEEGFGTLIALLFSAGLFGALHGFNPGASLMSTTAIALEAGLLLALAYTATRSLWLAIGLHFGWNFAEGGIFGAAVSGHVTHGFVSTTFSGDAIWSGGAFGPEASIVAVGVCLVAALVFLAATIRRGNWHPLRFRMWLSQMPSMEAGAAQ